jgi:hypothetical protein
VAKALTELHGGRVEVTSSLDTGSTFIVILMADSSQARGHGDRMNASADSAGPILMVEDDPVTARVVEHILESVAALRSATQQILETP